MNSRCYLPNYGVVSLSSNHFSSSIPSVATFLLYLSLIRAVNCEETLGGRIFDIITRWNFTIKIIITVEFL